MSLPLELIELIQAHLQDPRLTDQCAGCPDCAAQVIPETPTPGGPVTTEIYDRCAEDLLMEAQAIVLGKRPAYTNGSSDVLANFRRIAAMTNQTPGQVLATYMLKHVYAVTTALTNTEVKDPEETIGRFADAVNYLLLGWTMLATGIAHERQ